MQSFPSPRPPTMSCPVQSHNNSIIKLRRIGPHMEMWPNDVIKQLLDPPLVGYKWGALVNMPGMDGWMDGWLVVCCVVRVNCNRFANIKCLAAVDLRFRCEYIYNLI